MRVRQKPGVTLDQAIQTFEHLAANIHSEATARLPNVEIVDRLEIYVDWSVQAEAHL